MKILKTILAVISLFIYSLCIGQEQDKSASITLFTGMINYQGDLNPNSFTFKNSNFTAGLSIRKPLNRWLSARAGVNIGTIEAADRKNRDYLQPRNLSFLTSIKELYAGFEINLLDATNNRFTPYLFGGISLFHFNPWTYDNSGVKTFLKPLSTEGQGLAQYPKQRPYVLTQLALPFGGGFKYAINDGMNLGIEFTQHKSFTDYIDDVSTHFIDYDILLQAKGPKAVELAYRGDEVPGGQQAYPIHGEQRGTATEMDWFYFLGVTMEIKLGRIADLTSVLKGNSSTSGVRCPRNLGY